MIIRLLRADGPDFVADGESVRNDEVGSFGRAFFDVFTAPGAVKCVPSGIHCTFCRIDEDAAGYPTKSFTWIHWRATVSVVAMRTGTPDEDRQSSAFVPGIELSRRLYQDELSPVLAAAFPGLPYSAALLGRGSEVLGFDDEMSTDHDWHARVLIFLDPGDRIRHGDAVADTVRREVPALFQGYSTDCTISTLHDFVGPLLDVDIDDDIRACDWLTFPEQKLRMLTAGAVHHDEIGLQALRARFVYYPRDVWLYLMIAGWWRIHPELNLVGRSGYVGDELGSSLMGSQLVHDLMSLCFLMERQYAPYSKWFATAFSQLDCATELSPILLRVVRAETWPEREDALNAAYAHMALLHNALQITDPVTTHVEQMWGRPFKVTWADFPGVLGALIEDPEVKAIAERWPTGGVDQLRDMLLRPGGRRLLLRLIE